MLPGRRWILLLLSIFSGASLLLRKMVCPSPCRSPMRLPKNICRLESAHR